MEKKEINLCEILKGHEGKKFYSPIWGDTKFEAVDSMGEIVITPSDLRYNQALRLDSKGRMNPSGEPILYPSKEAFKNDDFEASWKAWAEESKKVTYEDILDELAARNNKPTKEMYVSVADEAIGDRLAAIAKLMNTQKWIENGWHPNWNNPMAGKYIIEIDDEDSILTDACISNNSHLAYFSSKENAHQAIKILGEDVIKQALSTDW